MNKTVDSYQIKLLNYELVRLMSEYFFLTLFKPMEIYITLIWYVWSVISYYGSRVLVFLMILVLHLRVYICVTEE